MKGKGIRDFEQTIREMGWVYCTPRHTQWNSFTLCEESAYRRTWVDGRLTTIEVNVSSSRRATARNELARVLRGIDAKAAPDIPQ